MGYRVPDNIIRQADMPDPLRMRQAAQPAAEELGGRVNDHNVKSGTFGISRRSTGMLLDVYTARVAADTGIHTNANDIPDGTSANAWRVPDSGEWTVVDQMVSSWTGGEDNLWLLGWLEYGICPTGAIIDFDLTETALLKPRIQVALRVNGAVLAETVTGSGDATERAPRSIYPVSPIDPATPTNNVSVDTYALRATSSMGWHVRPLRVQAFVPVPSGVVTAELVVRRVPPDDPGSIAGAVEPVRIYSRMVVALRLKRVEPTAAPAIQPVNVVYPEDGTISAAVLNGHILTPLQTAINDLGQGAIQAQGLRREHLPGGAGALRQAQQQAITAGTTTARLYPGWGSTGIVNAGNWDEVNDGAGTNLRVTGPWNYTTEPAFVLILANISHRKAYDPGLPPVPHRYGVYAIAGQYASATDFHTQAAEAHVNNPNVPPGWASAPNLFDCDADLPLMDFFDFRAAPPAGGVVSFYRALVAGDSSAGMITSWQGGSLQVLHFYP